jgi:hypothetical protein
VIRCVRVTDLVVVEVMENPQADAPADVVLAEFVKVSEASAC